MGKDLSLKWPGIWGDEADVATYQHYDNGGRHQKFGNA